MVITQQFDQIQVDNNTIKAEYEKLTLEMAEMDKTHTETISSINEENEKKILDLNLQFEIKLKKKEELNIRFEVKLIIF